MKAETRVAYGEVPHTLNRTPLAEASWQMEAGEFLLRGEGEHYFHYRKGRGVMIERGSDADISEESLWLNGSVYSAIASLNGLLPIHASAVVVDGAVFAFAGSAGAGKSTLVAALGRRGLPMFCDDTLILDVHHSGAIVCLPGHKRLKLTPDAVRLTGSFGQERVSTTVDKVYADPPAGQLQSPLPLGEIIFLEDGDEVSVRSIRGAESIARLQDDHYTSKLFARARGFSREDYFRHLVDLSNRVALSVFTRPRNAMRFDEGVAVALNYLTRGGTTAATS